MRLVDREQRDLGAFDQALETGGRGAFGGDVEKIQFAIAEGLGGGGVVAVGRGHRGGADARRARGANLVVHQRDQRRDDDGRASTGQRRDLVAQALARPGRHQRERMRARHDAADHRLLLPAEGGEAEGAVEDVMAFRRKGGGGHGHVHGRRPSPSRARWAPAASRLSTD